MLLQAIIFVTGGAILALELLASRIMTPYFGVSLYIWTGILSITLVSLALGYWAGGRLAAGRKDRAPKPEKLAFLFTLMPVLAALAIVAACLMYPYLFYHLAQLDLVLGAFSACLILLCVPLLATSAMNPLLVAIRLRQTEHGGLADAGAGRVFFVSTIGSVAGVLVTAFGLIPHLSNFASTLLVAASLAVLPLILLFATSIKVAGRKPLAVTAAVALAAALGLLAGADAYTGRMWPASYNGTTWQREASFRSMFGTIKILKSPPLEGGRFQRIYFQDGLIQNVVDADNRSMSLYTYALEALSFTYQPALRSALVLGLGAGMVPMRLAERGIAVTAVDIDAASLRAASEVFGFDRHKVRAHQTDARTFLRSCNNGYPVVIVDLFHGDGMPEYLITRDFFHDLKRCLGPDGIAVFNTFADLDYPIAYAHFLTTLQAELPFITLYRPDYPLARHLNSFVVAGAKPLPTPAGVEMKDVPSRHAGTLAAMLRAPRALDQKLLEHGRVITDARNTVADDMATSQINHRRGVVKSLPAAFLVN